ncbi:MAG: FAD-binding oxidoreductase [Desulfovibrionaceae bacterium CG1_02_65_16]|nr:MAG: FAD-binding oxidoreductase [Desulfovibrionaceae bacterium CG1_02_65_16]
MPLIGPHISISDERILTRVLGLTASPEEGGFAQWSDGVRELATSLAAELFLVRYNPFVDAELVRESVDRKLSIARPSLSGEFPRLLADAVAGFWERYEADQAFARKLKGRLMDFMPAEGIGDAPNTRIECATDATDLRLELPLFVLFPETTEQVRKIVLLANLLDFGIIPRGGGTGLTGGAIPMFSRTVVLSLARFKKIIDIDPDTMLLTAQAGVITLDAIKAAAEQNLLFTVDPASKAGSTLGGNISENSGGPFAFEYGTTIDNIHSFEMVTPRGEIITVRRKDHPRHKIFEGESAVFEILDEKGAIKDTITLAGNDVRATGLGKDVTNKYLGGLPGVQKEGVDGIITTCTFTLYPQPKYSRVLVLEFFGRSMKNAMYVIGDVVGLRDAIRKQGDMVKISALEEFGTKYVQAIEYKKKSALYEGDPISVLILQLDSDDEAALSDAVDAVLAIAKPYPGVDIFAARDDKEAELFWEDRHKLSAISKRTSGFKVNEDVVIPMRAIPVFAQFLENLNLLYMAKVVRKALLKVRELPGVPFDDPDIDFGIERALFILKKRTTADDLADEELASQLRLLFHELKDKYPKHDRELEDVYQEAVARRIVIANHMHAGDGNCHVNIPVNSNDPEMMSQAYEAVDEVFAEVLKLGGEITGEHGVGITKIGFLSQAKIDALKAYKTIVDPANVLNPGKLTRRDLAVEPYTFSFNRLIGDLRKTALKDKENLIELLKNVQTCTRCGKCKQVCPMYNPARGLLYHPRNKNLSLGALTEAIYYSQVQGGEPAPELYDELRRIMEHCTACGKCKAACPVKIDSAANALQIRSFLEYKGKGGHPIKTAIMGNIAHDTSNRLPKVAKFLSLGQAAANSVLGLIPGHFRRRLESPALQGPGPLMDLRNLSQELGLSEHSLFRNPAASPDETVLYFPGCGAGLFSHDIGLAGVYLLLKSGVNVVMPERHLCCGYPLLASGCTEAYNANRHRTIQEILDILIATGRAGMKATMLVTSCGTCRESIETYDFSQELSEPLKHLDIVQFLLGRLDRLALPKPEAGQGEKLLYHAACHAEWVDVPKMKAPEMYRKAIADALGAQVRLSPGCCGESGLGALTSPNIYNRIRAKKKEQLASDLARPDSKRPDKDTPIIVGCPSCRIGVKRCLMQMHRPNEVLHTTEYLAERLGGPKWKRELKRMLDSGEKKGRTVIIGAGGGSK